MNNKRLSELSRDGIFPDKAEISGIMLAAGYSSRAGGFKPQMPLGERTVLQHALDGMLKACGRVIVVGGHRIQCLRPLMEGYAPGAVELVENIHYHLGMFGSVQTGVRCLMGEKGFREAGFFIMPGDYPFIDPSVYVALVEALRANDAAGPVFVPMVNGRKGHPVLLRGKLAPLLAAAPIESNLRAFIDGVGFETVPVEDEGILKDIDTPADYQAALR